jgi:hypothetical protein
LSARPKRKSSNVESLFGGIVPVPRADPSVIAKIEGMLGRAKDGQLVALAYVEVDPQGGTIFGRAGTGHADSMIASIARLLHGTMHDECEP